MLSIIAILEKKNMKKAIIIMFSLLSALLLSACFSKKEVKFYGNIDTKTTTLSFQVSGKINKIFYEEGQNVKKGSLLVSLNPNLYKQYLAQAKASYMEQKFQVQKLENGYRKEDIAMAKDVLKQKSVAWLKAKKDLKRNYNLFLNKSISKQVYDNYKETVNLSKAEYSYAKNSYEKEQKGYESADINSAKAKANFLKAKLEEAKLNLSYCKLYAPNDAYVLTRLKEVGANTNTNEPVFELANSGKYWVRAYANERFLGKIKPNMKALIYTDSSKKVYKGRVSFISSVAEFTPKNVQTEDLRTDLVYRFRINLIDFDSNIKQGMPVTIRFPSLDK